MFIIIVARLQTLLFAEDEQYRREAEKLVPTTLDRLAENRARLKALRDRKEKERLELVQHKYLQQARCTFIRPVDALARSPGTRAALSI